MASTEAVTDESWTDFRVSSLEMWQELVAGVTGTITMLRGETQFEGVISRRQFGSTQLVRLATASPHRVIRDPTKADITPHRIGVSLQIDGYSQLEQNGRSARLQPGDFVIFTMSEPYQRTFPQGCETFLIVLPLADISLPGSVASQLSAVKVDGNNGFGRVVSQFLLGVSEHLHEFTGAAGARTAQSVVDLVAATLMLELDIVVNSREVQHRRLRAAVRAFIESQYHDPWVTSESIAANFFVSPRHLHNLFKPEGTTVAEVLRLARLRSAHRTLTDSNSAWMSVAQIASQSGYANATSFTRAFKAQYGANPGDLRPPRG